MADPLSPETRPRRIAHGVAALVTGQGVLAVGQMILVPVFLAHWSALEYGEWLVLSSAAAYLATLDLGMHMAAVNRLTQAYATGDLAGYRHIQASTLAFYGCLVAAGLAIIGVAGWLLPVTGVLGIQTISTMEAAATISLLALYVLLAMPFGLISSTYRTTGALATSQWVGTLQRLTTLVLTGVAVSFGGRMIAVATVQVSVLVVSGALIWLHLWSWRPELISAPADCRWGSWRPLVAPALMFALIMVANAITQQGPVLVVSSFLGGGAVAVFATSRMLCGLVRQVIGTLNAAIWPDVTVLDQREDYATLRLGHRLLVAVSSTLAAVLVGFLWVVGDDVLRAWTLGRVAIDPVLFRLLLAGTLLQTPWLASSVFMAASNRNRRLAVSYIWAACIGVVAGGLLLPHAGLAGMAGGLILGELIACYHVVIRDSCNALRESYGAFAVRLWSRLCLVTAVVVVSGSLIARWSGDGLLPRVFLVALVCGVTGLSTMWMLWLMPDERSHLRQSITSLLGVYRWHRISTASR